MWVNDRAVVMDYLITVPQAAGPAKTYPLIAVIPFEDGLMRGEHVTTVPEYAAILDKIHGDMHDVSQVDLGSV